MLKIPQSDNQNLKSITYCLKSGEYTKRLYLSKQSNEEIHPTSTKIVEY